jgi:hypothetical protein
MRSEVPLRIFTILGDKYIASPLEHENTIPLTPLIGLHHKMLREETQVPILQFGFGLDNSKSLSKWHTSGRQIGFRLYLAIRERDGFLVVKFLYVEEIPRIHSEDSKIEHERDFLGLEKVYDKNGKVNIFMRRIPGRSRA